MADDPDAVDGLWTRSVGSGGEPDSAALLELFQTYWYPIYVWWRRAGLDADSCAVATLASIEAWMGPDAPSAQDEGVDRVRDWVPARLRQCAESGVKLHQAPAFEIDEESAEERYAAEPEGEVDAVFERAWSIIVVDTVMIQLKAEFKARGEEAAFKEYKAFSGFDQSNTENYSSVAQRLGQTSGSVRKAVFDFRNRQRELLMAMVRDTVLDPSDAESEVTALMIASYGGEGDENSPVPTSIQGLRPDEVFARAMRSVQMTTDGSGNWIPPTIEEATLLFPQYEVSDLIGRGGMGAVYRGRQVELDRTVAIKLLPLEVSVDPNFADRFRREARAMAKLHHPNIISIHDFGTTTEGHLYFVMEYVEGTDLHQLIHGVGVDPDQALSIITGTCDALAYAHGKGVVHRDIKPANIMVSTEGEVKVADFGLARLTDPGPEELGRTMTGAVMGTPDYMAPEQTRGMDVDHRADIYSLGVMLYEMLCGEVPRGIFDPPSVRVPGVSEKMDQLVIRAMQQQPDRRYQSTQEMKAEVKAVRTGAAHPAGRAKSKKPASVGGGSGNKLKLIYMVSGAVALLVVLLAISGVFSSKPSEPESVADSSSSQPAVEPPAAGNHAAKPAPNKPAQAKPKPPKPSPPKPRPNKPLVAVDNTKPVQVFLLMGSASMMGRGQVDPVGQQGTLRTLVKQQNRYPYLLSESGGWATRQDVKSFRMRHGFGTREDQLEGGPLTVRGNFISVDQALGKKLGDAMNAPVLLLNVASGNRSLGWDLLPPGSNRFVENGRIYAGYKDNRQNWVEGDNSKPSPKWYAGKQYDIDVGAAKKVLADFKTHYPDAPGYEIAGIFWWQGHRDTTSGVFARRYEQNLVQMIKALRDEFKAPKAPFVIASYGVGGTQQSGIAKQIHEAQFAVSDDAKYPQFKGNVVTIDSRPHWRGPAQSPALGGPEKGYYHHNAETYMEVGLEMGDAMVEMLLLR